MAETAYGVTAVPDKWHPESLDEFNVGEWPGWHGNTYLLQKVAKRFTNDVTIDGFKIKGSDEKASGGGQGSSTDSIENIWNGTGFGNNLYHKKDYYTNIFYGTDVDSSKWTETNFIYNNQARHHNVFDVGGIAFETSISGSFSDKGGNSQARVNKCVMFYSDDRKRMTFEPTNKFKGNWSFGDTIDGYGHKWTVYKHSREDAEKISRLNLVWTGIAFEFYHTGKGSQHTSAANIYNLRPIITNNYDTYNSSPDKLQIVNGVSETFAQYNGSASKLEPWCYKD